MAGFLQGLGQFVDRIPAYMFPGLGQPGVDPGMVQQARGQALMQMGAGIASGQDVAKAYGLGQAAGYEPIEQWRRQETLRMAQEDRAGDKQYRELLMKDREQKLKDEEAARAKAKQIDEILTPPLPETEKERAAEFRRRADKVRGIDLETALRLENAANSIEGKVLQQRQMEITAGNIASDNARQARAEDRANRAERQAQANARAEGLGKVADVKAAEAIRVALKQMSENPEGSPLWNSAATVYRQWARKDVPTSVGGVPISSGGGLGTVSTGAADQYVVGQVYTDASGNKARYKGNGEWEEL